MIHRFIAAFALVLAAVSVSAQSDLDAFMSQVLARRDDNWTKLQQYTLTEDETFQLAGPGDARLYGFRREYDWFPRDGLFVRSPTRADGVAIADAERRRAEERWINDEQERAKRTDPVASNGEPRFVSTAYFMKFKFEPGHYALVGRERLLDREVLRIEYYPARMYADEDKDGKPKPPDNPGDARIERGFSKVALITLWIEPTEKQILQYEFHNIDFDFLPGRSMGRLDTLTASMRMGQPFPGVWLPETIAMRSEGSAALGTFTARYDVRYRDYKEAVTGGRLR